MICDSQVVLKAAADTPADVRLTTFSILMARFKADLVKLPRGAAAIHRPAGRRPRAGGGEPAATARWPTTSAG